MSSPAPLPLPSWAKRCASAPTSRTALLQVEYLLRAQELLLSLPADSSRDSCILLLDAYRHELWEQSSKPRKKLRYSVPPTLAKRLGIKPTKPQPLPDNLEDLF